MATLLNRLSVIWAYLVIAFIGICCVGHIATEGIWAGIKDILYWFSPFNVLNWAMVLILILPSIMMQIRSDKLESRHK